MTQEEWLKLLRQAKSDNDYDKLIICVRGFIMQNRRTRNGCQSISSFIDTYTLPMIRNWYKDRYVFETLSLAK